MIWFLFLSQIYDKHYPYVDVAIFVSQCFPPEPGSNISLHTLCIISITYPISNFGECYWYLKCWGVEWNNKHVSEDCKVPPVFNIFVYKFSVGFERNQRNKKSLCLRVFSLVFSMFTLLGHFSKAIVKILLSDAYWHKGNDAIWQGKSLLIKEFLRPHCNLYSMCAVRLTVHKLSKPQDWRRIL